MERRFAKEINDDIETYRYHPNCDDLVFFIYDPDGRTVPCGAHLKGTLERAAPTIQKPCGVMESSNLRVGASINSAITLY